MGRPSVYVETTIVSYLAARPSRDVIVAGHQQVTRDWWDFERSRFRLVTWPLVRKEVAAGHPPLAESRLRLLDTVTMLEVTPVAAALARSLVEDGPLPSKADVDAVHIAVAAVHAVDYLLTWNCRHIANAAIQTDLIRACEERGFKAPVLCTPIQLSGAD